VTSLVQDVLMPPLGWIMGGLDFSNLFFTLNGQDYASLKAAQDAGAPTINYGIFINAIIKFIIVSFAVFWLVKAVNKFKQNEADAPAKITKSEELLAEIRDLLKK
jgi:large conductance mechanosensitive channel